jgi:RNA polymerase sigma-70 factor (ECF subfamily)
MKRLSVRRDDSLDEPGGSRETMTRVEPTVFDALVRAQTVEAIRAGIESLPSAFREAIVLCELQELPYADAATVMQIPIGTVRSRVHRAKALLAARFGASAILQEG